MSRKSIIIIEILLGLILIFFLLARQKGAPSLLFWPILWAIVIFALLGSKLDEKHRIVIIVILEVLLALIPIVALPAAFQAARDIAFESQFANTIVREGRWDASLGTGFAKNYYGHNPALHFVLAFLSLTTGLSTYFLSKYILIIILRVIFILCAYLVISTILKKHQNLAYYATILYMASPRLALMGISRRLIASIFVLLTVYVMLKEHNALNWILFCIFSTMIIVADHSMSSLFMVFLALGLAATILSRLISLLNINFFKKYKIIIPGISVKLLFFIGILGLWNVMISTALIQTDLTYIFILLKVLFTQQSVNAILGTSLGGASALKINHLYENITIYASQFIFLLLGGIGFLYYLKKPDKLNKKPFFLYFALFAIPLYVLSGFLMLTSLDVISQTFMWFFGLPLSIFAVYTFYLVKKRWSNASFFAALTIILIFSGGLLVGYNPTIINRAPGEDLILEFAATKNKQLFESGQWLKDHSKPESTVLGDGPVFDIYSGFYEFDAVSAGYAKDFYLAKGPEEINYFLTESVIFGHSTGAMTRHTIDYAIVNNAIFRYPSNLVGDPPDPSIKNKFDEAYIDRIYDNGEIIIYHNFLASNPSLRFFS